MKHKKNENLNDRLPNNARRLRQKQPTSLKAQDLAYEALLAQLKGLKVYLIDSPKLKRLHETLIAEEEKLSLPTTGLEGLITFQNIYKDEIKPLKKTKDYVALINASLSLLNDPKVMILVNDTRKRALRKSIKRLAESHHQSIECILVKFEGPPTNMYVINEKPISLERLSRRQRKSNLSSAGQILGFVVALGCGFATGVAAIHFFGLPIGITVGIAGFLANVYLFRNSTANNLVTLLGKSVHKGIFRGLEEPTWGNRIKKALIVGSLVFAVAAGISLGSLGTTSTIGTLAAIGVVGVFPWVFAAIIGIATLFGITAIMFNSMSSLVRTTRWIDIKTFFRKLFWYERGHRPEGTRQWAMLIIKMVASAICLVAAITLGTLGAIALLGVMKGATVNLLTTLFANVPAMSGHVVAIIAAVIVFGLNGIPRFIFNIKNSVRAISGIGRSIIETLETFVQWTAKTVKDVKEDPLSTITNFFDKIKEKVTYPFGSKKHFIYTVKVTASAIALAFLEIQVAINALGNAIMMCLKSGVDAMSVVLAPLHLPTSLDAPLSATGGGLVSLAVNHNATYGHFTANNTLSTEVQRGLQGYGELWENIDAARVQEGLDGHSQPNRYSLIL